MRYMTRSLTHYYLIRLLTFWPKKRVARELGVSAQTLNRWVNGELPSEQSVKSFQRALRRLTDWLYDRPEGFFSHLADTVLLEEPPQAELMEQRLDLNIVKNRARDLMILNGQVKSTELYDEFLELGYTRSQINYVCHNMLGYRRKAKGRGRNSHTIWREQ